MLTKSFRMEFCRPPNPTARHLRCVASLDADITELLPFLNTELGAHQYFSDPPTLTLKLPGKLVTLHPTAIAINIVQNEQEAEDILCWLQEKINDVWVRRNVIEPTFAVRAKPRVLDALKLLPKTNCGRCGHPTCMVFAVKLCDGVSSLADCPALEGANMLAMQEHFQDSQFRR